MSGYPRYVIFDEVAHVTPEEWEAAAAMTARRNAMSGTNDPTAVFTKPDVAAAVARRHDHHHPGRHRPLDRDQRSTAAPTALAVTPAAGAMSRIAGRWRKR